MNVPSLSRLGHNTLSQQHVQTLFHFDETLLIIQNMIRRMADDDDDVRSICENVVNVLLALRVQWRRELHAVVYSQRLFYVTIKELLLQLGNVQARDAAEAMYDILNYFDNLPQDEVWQIDRLLSDRTGRPVELELPFPIFAVLCNFINHQLATRRLFQYISDFLSQRVMSLSTQTDANDSVKLHNIQTIASQVAYKLQNLPITIRYSDFMTELRVDHSTHGNGDLNLTTNIYIQYDEYNGYDFTGEIKRVFSQMFSFIREIDMNISFRRSDDEAATVYFKQSTVILGYLYAFNSMLEDPSRILARIKRKVQYIYDGKQDSENSEDSVSDFNL